jgi:hypothetical protein
LAAIRLAYTRGAGFNPILSPHPSTSAGCFPGRAAFAAGNEKAKVFLQPFYSLFERTAECRGHTAGMPVETEHSTKSLKPERMRKSVEHFIGTEISHNDDSNFAGEFHPTLEKPSRCFTVVKWKVSDSGAS